MKNGSEVKKNDLFFFSIMAVPFQGFKPDYR
jgi:hypothetical protein